MRYCIILKKGESMDVFLKLEDIAFKQASDNKYILFKVFYSKLMLQKIYLNLN